MRSDDATQRDDEADGAAVAPAAPDIDVENLIERVKMMRDSELLMSQVVTEYELDCVSRLAREQFAAEPALIELDTLDAPLHIAGDIHGQFADLMRLFDLVGYPSEEHPWLFLGDYVDRGKQSLETIALLFAYKVSLPRHVWLLRGNHECASVNRYYGFYDECRRRYSARLWQIVSDTFAMMPLSALVAQRILCMHGGLSPRLLTYDDLRNVPRPMLTIPDSGLACDLLWSDPELSRSGWWLSQRGTSVQFGADVVQRYKRLLQIDLVCRAHQVVEDGYEFFADRSLVTLFSAPNYCGVFDNAAAVMTVGPDLLCSFFVMRAPEQVPVEMDEDEMDDALPPPPPPPPPPPAVDGGTEAAPADHRADAPPEPDANEANARGNEPRGTGGDADAHTDTAVRLD